jgi:ATP-binding cassette subfamily B protein
VIAILLTKYEPSFALIAAVTLTLYVTYTFKVTNWRTALRRQANEFDSAANARAIDSLINYETVKYFNNEHFEAARYDSELKKWTAAQIRNQKSLSYLNVGQALIIAFGVTAMMWRAALGVAAGRMSLGDLVLVNAFLIQLYVPLNFLGVIYREIRQALTDIERMFGLMAVHREVADSADAQPLARGHAALRFENVGFAYETSRQILFGVDFAIPAGKTVAVVGHSGSGKSTLARLLFRFYDVQSGAVRVNGVDIRELSQDSLRAAIGIVPQDTVLFNDSLFYNIQYGRPEASREEVEAAARATQLTDFIARLPDG